MNMMRFTCTHFVTTFSVLIIAAAINMPVFASTYPLPSNEDNLIGNANYVIPPPGDTLLNIAEHFDLGLNGILDANPGIGPVASLPGNMRIHVPTVFLLPPLARQGIVINLAEMRLYYFPSSSKDIVMTYPIGIGRVGKTIPLVRTAVTRKAKNPTWIPPADIRAFNKEKGIVLPHSMPAGPDNPLGPYAIYLKVPTYLIHSTIFPDSVGRRASFGCIRMHEADIEDFFPLITPGTPVTIVNMPSKVGWQGDYLYLESHQPLEEHSHEFEASFSGIISIIQNATRDQDAFIDWQLVSYIGENRDGVPHEIGFKLH